MAKEYARKGVLTDIFAGALKGILANRMVNMTRTGMEGFVLKTIQDITACFGADSMVDKVESMIPKENQKK